MEIVYKDESYALVATCFAVYNEMAYGFTEPIYQECLEIELTDRGNPFSVNRKIVGFPRFV